MITITVDGLDDILDRLDRLPPEAQRAFEKAAKATAQVNALRVRLGAAMAGRQAAAAAGSVHASGTAIVGGGPFFMGSVFGGQGRPTTQQFRPYNPRSYWFFTTLRGVSGDTLRRFDEVLTQIEKVWVS